MPKVSVIIPCYNQGEYVDEAINSILVQTLQDFEIIVVNDGSTDDFTNEKLKNFSYLKTKVIYTENKGLSSARNTGFKEAKGEFMQFLDADDTILPAKFEEQLSVFNQYPEIGVCYTDFKIYDIIKDDFLNLPEKKFLGENPLIDFLFRWERGLSIPIHCALFKKSLWVQELPFNEELKAKEDWFMWCSLAIRNIRFHYLDKEYAVYRFHENNMSKDIFEMNYASYLSSYYIMQIIPEKFKKEFLKATIVHINKSLEKNVYPNLVNQISDLKNKFLEMDKTIDYKIGHLLLKPYRFFKTNFLRKKYL
jgi:glycosyltransferase involved in cell wall biosynthesis